MRRQQNHGGSNTQTVKPPERIDGGPPDDEQQEEFHHVALQRFRNPGQSTNDRTTLVTVVSRFAMMRSERSARYQPRPFTMPFVRGRA